VFSFGELCVVFSELEEEWKQHALKVEDAFFVKGGGESEDIRLEIGVAVALTIREHQRRRFEINNG